jgi:hypothetical protein
MIIATIASATVSKKRDGETLHLTWTAECGAFLSDRRTYEEEISVAGGEAAAKLARWRIRSLCRACGLNASQIGDGGNLRSIAKTLANRRAGLVIPEDGPTEYERPPPRRPTLSDRAGCVGYDGERLKTGFASLDGDATRGGLPFGKIVVLGAAPCGSKTMIGLAWAHRWAEAGVPVFYLPTDGGAEDVMVRLGQRFGFDRGKLEAGDAETRKAFAKSMKTAGLPLDLDDELTIEAGTALLDDMCRERRTPRGVLFVDSLQTAITIRHDDRIRDPRARVDATVEALRCVRRAGHLIVCTSEVPRTFYGSKKRGEALAAFKESGSVEYAADLAILLAPDHKAGPDIVRVEVTQKNRLGSGRPIFSLRIDRVRAGVAELASTPSHSLDGKANKPSQMVDDVLAAFERLGQGNWSESRIREVVQQVRGRDGRADTTTTRKALAELVDRSVIEPRPSKGGSGPAYGLVGRLAAGGVAPLEKGPTTNHSTTQPPRERRVQ